MLEPSFMRFTRDENIDSQKATPKQIEYIKASGYDLEDTDFNNITIDEAFEIIKEIEDFRLEIACECYMEDVGDR